MIFISKCWEYAKKCREEYIKGLNVKSVSMAHFSSDNIRKVYVNSKTDLARVLQDYMRDSELDPSFYDWNEYDIIVQNQHKKILYGNSTLEDGCIDISIPFIIPFYLIKDFEIYYPFQKEGSSITVLKILDSPFVNGKDNEKDKIQYNNDKEKIYNDKIVVLTNTQEVSQVENTDDISRNILNETVKQERKNHNYDMIGREER